MAIVTKDKDNHIGNVSLQEINYLYRTADLGIVIGEKGLLGARLFQRGRPAYHRPRVFGLKLKPHYLAAPMRKTFRCRKLALAMGFAKEGIRRRAVYKNNRFWMSTSMDC